MSWTHPKSWRQLRTLELLLYRGAIKVAAIKVRPHGERLSAYGAVKLMSDSRVTHRDKTVTARLAMRLGGSLAGAELRVAVQATDRHGHKQLEPNGGVIRVAR